MVACVRNRQQRLALEAGDGAGLDQARRRIDRQTGAGRLAGGVQHLCSPVIYIQLDFGDAQHFWQHQRNPAENFQAGCGAEDLLTQAVNGSQHLTLLARCDLPPPPQ